MSPGESDAAKRSSTLPSERPPRFEPAVIYLNHIRAQDIVPMLQPILKPGEAVVQGPDSQTGIEDVSDLGGNTQATREMVVLLAEEETKVKVESLIEQLDVPPQQVLVEATIMAVDLDEEAVLGVDFNAFGGIDFQALGSQTDITGSISQPGQLAGPQLQDWLLGVNQTGFTQPGSTGIHLGILRNQVGVFVEAVEKMGQVAIISNPKVTTLNRMPAQVLVGRKIGYQTVTATETSTVQNIQFLEVGTSLVFRPFVSEDGFVRLEIQPKSSDGVINPQTGLPEESTTEVSANVLVRSGNTVVIGGLMETQVITNTTQVPFLGSLPILGNLFRREDEQERRLEVVILLTPHIVTESDLVNRAQEQSERLFASVSELAASHHGYLRPSMARRMYSAASAALAAGNLEEALAKAEFGLVALPADPDLASLARHVREELNALEVDDVELRDAIDLLDRVTAEEL